MPLMINFRVFTAENGQLQIRKEKVVKVVVKNSNLFQIPYYSISFSFDLPKSQNDRSREIIACATCNRVSTKLHVACRTFSRKTLAVENEPRSYL